MKVYKVKKDCSLKIQSKIKEFKKDEIVKENTFTKIYKDCFKEIGEVDLSTLNQKEKIVFAESKKEIAKKHLNELKNILEIQSSSEQIEEKQPEKEIIEEESFDEFLNEDSEEIKDLDEVKIKNI